jgi:hypothetical protein
VTIYVDSRPAALRPLVSIDLEKQDWRIEKRNYTSCEMELDEGPITPAHGSPVHLGPGEFEMRPDTFNKHRLDVRGLSHVES